MPQQSLNSVNFTSFSFYYVSITGICCICELVVFIVTTDRIGFWFVLTSPVIYIYLSGSITFIYNTVHIYNCNRKKERRLEFQKKNGTVHLIITKNTIIIQILVLQQKVLFNLPGYQISFSHTIKVYKKIYSIWK